MGLRVLTRFVQKYTLRVAHLERGGVNLDQEQELWAKVGKVPFKQNICGPCIGVGRLDISGALSG